MRSFFRLGLVVALAAGGMVAIATAALAAAVATISPDTDLVPGQTVTLTASGFPPNAEVRFRQCNDSAVPACAPSTTAVTDDQGGFAVAVELQRYVNGADCLAALNPCSFLVVKQVTSGEFASVDIDFADYSRPWPDLFLQSRCVGCGTLFDNEYTLTPCGGDFPPCVDNPQTKVRTIEPGTKWSFALRVQNDGLLEDDITVTDDFQGSSIGIRYFVGYDDVTAQVHGDGLVFHDVAPGEVRKYTIQFAMRADAPPGTSTILSLTGASGRNPNIYDFMRVGVQASS